MTGGLLDYLTQATNIVRDTGVTFDDALEIVYAAHEPKPPPVSNVIYGTDFLRRQAKEENGLA